MASISRWFSPTPGSSFWTFEICHACARVLLGPALMGLGLTALAQEPGAVPEQHAPAQQASDDAAQAPPSGWRLVDKRLGVAWWHYREPVMRLQGPALTLQLGLLTPAVPGMPDRVGGEIMLARVDYSSDGTGQMSGVPAVGWRAHALWDMPPVSRQPWQLGLQYEGLWNDLRGTSSTGHRGYERLSNKLWLLAQTAPLPQAELQLGLLLRGWQDSWLSQANQRLPDITNVQHKGVTLRYRHSPWLIGSRPVFPWLRYTQVAESDKVGIQRWHEPRNRSMEMGLEAQF